jgi:hypothetical protein
MHEMLKTVFGNNTMGATLAEDCKHSGHPSTGCTGKNVAKVHKIANKNQ